LWELNQSISLKDVRKKLHKLGFERRRKSKHEIWDNGKGIIVPLSHGNQDVGPTLLKSIFHQLRISPQEFLDI
jgi:predicted RNA binding protein YcfA (HicA-like mRNA interferase family)